MGFKVMFLGLVNYILKPDRQLLSRTDVEVTSCSVARTGAIGDSRLDPQAERKEKE